MPLMYKSQWKEISDFSKYLELVQKLSNGEITKEEFKAEVAKITKSA